MASLRHRCNRWHVQIRKSGHSSINKSFIKKADAERWARETEVAIENGTIRTGAEHSLKTPLANILTRYQREISAHKAGVANRSAIMVNRRVTNLSLCMFLNANQKTS